MDIELLQDLLLWSTVINYGVLLLWFFIIVVAREGVYRLHGRWLPLTMNQFDVVHYCGMALYKVLVLVFNLVPLIVLHIIA